MEEKINALSFEDAMKRLEEVLRELESQTAPLEKMLSLYEEGVALVERCNRILDSAVRRVTKIVKKDGDFEEEPFGDANE
ncbi:MAG TPA: exodeoxyribonuclease VII small subunit [Bacillota bacterium]|nr:exodeoxyribonuclease VII small subunit [Bacillota bacterium]